MPADSEVVSSPGSRPPPDAPPRGDSRARKPESVCSREASTGLEAARNEVEELGGTALVIPTDVADAA